MATINMPTTVSGIRVNSTSAGSVDQLPFNRGCRGGLCRGAAAWTGGGVLEPLPSEVLEIRICWLQCGHRTRRPA